MTRWNARSISKEQQNNNRTKGNEGREGMRMVVGCLGERTPTCKIFYSRRKEWWIDVEDQHRHQESIKLYSTNELKTKCIQKNC